MAWLDSSKLTIFLWLCIVTTVLFEFFQANQIKFSSYVQVSSVENWTSITYNETLSNNNNSESASKPLSAAKHYSLLDNNSEIVLNATKNLPEWVKEYLQWHAEQRLHHLNDTNTKFLVVACLRNQKCGGTADRLKPLPYFLFVANRTRRILLIKWEKFQLEEFVIPPMNGLDWRYPTNVDMGSTRYFRHRCQNCHLYDDKDVNIHNTKTILTFHQQDPYMQVRNFFVTPERPFGTYREIMQILFQPTPSLAHMIDDTMSKLNLVPGQYISAHLRMRYPNRATRPPTFVNHLSNDTRDLELFRSWAINSINCVIQKANTTNLPVYFAADYEGIISYILHESPFVNSSINIVGIEILRDHLEFPVWHGNSTFDQHEASEFYSVFLDLWILGNSKCVSHGLGGYGLWASRWAGEECVIKHRHTFYGVNKCPSLLNNGIK